MQYTNIQFMWRGVSKQNIYMSCIFYEMLLGKLLMFIKLLDLNVTIYLSIQISYTIVDVLCFTTLQKGHATLKDVVVI